jgi:VanZ family protein
MANRKWGDTERASGWWRWAIVAAYMGAIFFASAGPGVPLPPGRNWDKLLHAGAYAVLSALVIWAAMRGRWREATGPVLLAAWIVATAYGASDEVHQYFVPGRHADPADLAADAVGALVAAGAVRAWGIIARGSERHNAL